MLLKRYIIGYFRTIQLPTLLPRALLTCGQQSATSDLSLYIYMPYVKQEQIVELTSNSYEGRKQFIILFFFQLIPSLTDRIANQVFS